MGAHAFAEFPHGVCHLDNYFMSCFPRIVSLSNRPADHSAPALIAIVGVAIRF